MIVTCNKKSNDKRLSGNQVRNALSEHGWFAGQSYTLDGNLIRYIANMVHLCSQIIAALHKISIDYGATDIP